jgi:hypothetical protein
MSIVWMKCSLIHIRARELCPLPHHFVDCVQEITFRRYLSARTNRKHTRLGAKMISGEIALSKKAPTSVATDLSSAPVLFGQRRAMRSNRIPRSTLMLLGSHKLVSKWTQTVLCSVPSGVDPQYMSSPLIVW